MCHEIIEEKLKINFSDIKNFSKAGLIMTIFGYITSVILYDILNLKAYYMGILFIPISYSVRYYVYKKFWRDKNED